MAMGIGGVIGQALLGGLQGAGNAAAYVGKSQYDSEMAAKQAEADQQRKKDLMALQDELAGNRYKSNATFDTSEGLNRMQRDQQFKVDNNDTNTAMAVRNNSALAAGNAADVVANQPALTDAEFQKGKTMQPLRMDEINAQGDKAIRVAQASAGPQNTMAAIAQARENRVNEASGLLANAMNAVEDAGTPEEKKAAQKDLDRAQRNFAILNGKNPGNMGGRSESIELLKQASELDKQIKDSRDAAFLLPPKEKEEAMKGVNSMIQQRAKIMAMATGGDSVPASSATVAAFLKTAPQDKPATASSKPDTRPSPALISEAIGAKPADAPADLQAIKTQLDQESAKLSQLDTKQGGAVPRSQIAANEAKQRAQQQIVDDLKLKLNKASENYGSYPYGRY